MTLEPPTGPKLTSEVVHMASGVTPFGRQKPVCRKAPTCAELIDHLAALGVSHDGQNYVVKAASSPPARKASNSNGRNLIGEMHCVAPAGIDTAAANWRIQFESMSGEFAFCALTTVDPSVFLFLDQPNEPIQLTVHDAKGHKRRINYTPDYLVVYEHKICVYELKPMAGLIALCNKYPHDWFRNAGDFQYRPAERYFEGLGIQFKVVPNECLSWIKVQNLRILECARVERLEDELRHQIRKFVASKRRCSINDILRALKLNDARPVLAAVLEQAIFVDLENAALYDQESKVICASTTLAAEVGGAIAQLRAAADTTQTLSLEQTCDPKHELDYAYRLSVVAGAPIARESGANPSRRTIQRWKKSFREGGKTALMPQWYRCGTKGPRTPAWHYELIANQIRQDRGSDTHPTRQQSYLLYKDALGTESESRGPEEPVSYSHYCELWKARQHLVADARRKGGHRLANASLPHCDVDAQVPLVSGPFQVAQIDHCLAPCFVGIGGRSKPQLPWLTVLVDMYGPVPLAWVLRFEPPSSAADGLLLRDCIRRHGRLPGGIFSDGGADFRGVPFALMLCEFGIDWIKRPRSLSRDGAEIERTFQTFATSVCAGARGYMPSAFKMRSVSRSKHPANLPPRQLPDFFADTEDFLMRRLPTVRPRSGGLSPLEMRLAFENVYGPQGIHRDLDLAALIATAQRLDDIKSRCSPAGAIRYQGRRFYSEALYGKSCAVSSLSPRLDLELHDQIYLCVDGRWVVAKARSSMSSRGRTLDSTRIEAMTHGLPPVITNQERIAALHRSTKRAAAQHNQEQQSTPPNDLEREEPQPAKEDWRGVSSFASVTSANPLWGTNK